MKHISCGMTVLFDTPFWVGIFELVEDEKLTVAKVTFGSEPKDYEVYDFILHHYDDLKFSPSISVNIKKIADNPKRRQRVAQKQVQSNGIGTKSQQALQLQMTESKIKRQQRSKEQREAEKQRQFDLKQQKRKQKKKGH